ncbi:hypothetical protein AALB51_16725 [Lachnospiraceae bacterium 62-26]|nr:hypothetical protein IMSAGC020_01177 [Lachnospiraceae bacterium]
MKYRVIHKFRDLQDDNHIYSVGDEYKGKKSQARIKELSTDANKIGRPLIEKITEEKQS